MHYDSLLHYARLLAARAATTRVYRRPTHSALTGEPKDFDERVPPFGADVRRPPRGRGLLNALTLQHRKGYNERLFGGGWRTALHTARFHWLAQAMRSLRIDRVTAIELGCFDGKTIEFLERAGIRVERYLGLDANYEHGIDIGRHLWRHRPEVALRVCRDLNDIPTPVEPWDVAICMETLEHIQPDLVEPYLSKLCSVTRHWLFVTGPIEIGPLFLLRHAYRRLSKQEDNAYDLGDVVNSVLGRSHRVHRGTHVGFDYRVLIRQIGRYADVVSVTGIVPGRGPLPLNFQFGVLARIRS